MTFLAMAAAIGGLAGCASSSSLSFTKEESALINASGEVMRILTVDSAKDLEVLRGSSRNLNVSDLNTPDYESLVRKMTQTLASTPRGVGLAAPQIGISRRVVAVKRVDKEGEPIEVYPNIFIQKTSGEKVPGQEGCLSAPDERGQVERYQDITICYTDINSDRMDQPRLIYEQVSGYAAVIFQHEVDHLDGVLFIDRIEH